VVVRVEGQLLLIHRRRESDRSISQRIKEEEKAETGHELQNFWIHFRDQRGIKLSSVYRWSNTLTKHLQGAGRKIVKGGSIPILVRRPKNSVFLHPGD